MSKLCSGIRTACQSSMQSVLKCCKLTFIFALSVEDLVFTFTNLVDLCLGLDMWKFCARSGKLSHRCCFWFGI